MGKSYQIVRVARWVLLVLAYLFGIGLQGVLAGVVPLVMGGEPVPLVTGISVPARVLGAVNLFLSAPVTFIMFHAFASLIQLLLDIRDRMERIGPSGG